MVIGIQIQKKPGPWFCVVLNGGHRWSYDKIRRLHRCSVCGKERLS